MHLMHCFIPSCDLSNLLLFYLFLIACCFQYPNCDFYISVKVVPYTSGKIWSARLIFLFFLAVCLNISTVINIKILTNSNQQTQSYKFTSHTAAFLSVVLITEMLEICIQTSYDQNVQLILKSYLLVVYGTPLSGILTKSTVRFLFVKSVVYTVPGQASIHYA
jgi:hypothetical protein